MPDPSDARLGCTPIDAEQPAGVSVRYEPEFEGLQREMEKMESVVGEPVNWGEVGRLSRQILSSRSKDLLVAAYFALGLLKLESYRGLGTGLTVFRDLLEGFWESLFPPLEKIRGRDAAVRWLAEHLTKALAGASPSPEDKEALEATFALSERIEALVKERFPGGGPPFSDLPRALGELIQAIPAPAAAAVEAPVEPGVETRTVIVKDVVDSEEKARGAVLEAVAFLRKSRPSDPRPYRLLRAVLWDEVPALPPHKEGVTGVVAPDRQALSTWEEGLRGGGGRRVLDEVEARLPSERLWLDLNFLAVRALEALGEEFSLARAAVLDELGALVRRLPELLDLRFQGGEPLASDTTRIWIRNEVAPPTRGPSAVPDKLAEALKEARRLVARRQLPAASSLLQAGMQGLTQGRDRFFWRLELAKLCVEGGQNGLALPLFESLDEEVARYRLEEWEPLLSAEVVKSLWRCYSAFREREGFAEKAAQVYARLCRLDLTAAMALDGRK